MIGRLRKKIIALLMTVTALFLVVLYLVIVGNVQRSAWRHGELVLERVLAMPKQQLQLGEDRKLANMFYFVIDLSSEGEVSVESSGPVTLDNEPILQEVADRVAASPSDCGTLEDLGLSYVRKEWEDGIRIACVDIRQEQLTLDQLRMTLLGISILALTGCFFAAWAVAKLVTRPIAQSLQRQEQLVADVSHELKTPLTVILSCIRMLRSHPDGDRQQREDWEESVEEEAQRMKKLTEERLFLAQADEARLVLRQQQVNFRDLTEGEVLLFEASFFEMGKQLYWTCTQEELSLQGDPDQLQRMVEILLENGLKYTTPGGSTPVRLGRANAHRASDILLTVESQGKEIAQEALPRLFDRFYREDPARQTSGSGLGLSVAQTIVTGHGGQIWAESGQGKNTFFCPATGKKRNVSPGLKKS